MLFERVNELLPGAPVVRDRDLDETHKLVVRHGNLNLLAVYRRCVAPLKRMQFRVKPVRGKRDKICGAIVRSVAIEVMDDFCRAQLPTDPPLDYVTVFKRPLAIEER